MKSWKTPHQISIEELKHSQELFRLLVEGVQDYAIYMLDPTGVVSSWNTGAERIKGYRADEIIGKNFSCFFLPEDQAAGRPQRVLATAAREGKYTEERLRMRKDGSVFWASILITALYDSSGTLRGFAKVVRDITERKEAERKLQDKERLATLGITAAVFAHEVANPLNGISTSLQITKRFLQKAGFNDSTVFETLESANREVERLTSLLKNYREIARPNYMKCEPTDVAGVIKEVLAPAILSYRNLGITVKIKCDENLPLVNADKEKLKQAILNLCKNAVEAMPKGGILEAKAYETDRRVIVEIGDTGVGIPDSMDIFKPFNTTKPEGTGLGLAIVQQIVSDHQGTLAYVSEPNKGTTFTLSFRTALALELGGTQENGVSLTPQKNQQLIG